MQVFELIWVRWLVVMLGGGLALALALYLGFGAAAPRPEAGERERFPGGIEVGRGPIPTFLLFLFCVVAMAMLGYVIHTCAMRWGF